MATINYRQITKLIAQDEAMAREIREIVNNAFEAGKREMIQDFENHEVTQEIRRGIEADNISNTLAGAGGSTAGKESGGRPNLFSFIGFDSGTDPIAPVRTVLENETRLHTRATAIQVEADMAIKYTYTAMWPAESIKRASPIPRWASDLSWVEGIEEGISGFSEYLYGLFPNPPSHSLGGVQTEKPVRAGDFSPPKEKYMTKIFNDFVNRLRS